MNRLNIVHIQRRQRLKYSWLLKYTKGNNNLNHHKGKNKYHRQKGYRNTEDNDQKTLIRI